MQCTVGQLGQVLGPREAMPAPKVGTVTQKTLLEKQLKMQIWSDSLPQ